MNRAAIGFTVKSGWASAVVVAGTRASPQVRVARRLDLSDPALPDSRQPYHAGFGTARDAGAELSRLVASVERFGRESVTRFIQDLHDAGLHPRGAGIVVGSVTDPARIANAHIRIHALEGQLFRRVVDEAANACRLPSRIWRERDLYPSALTLLKKPEPDLRAILAGLGRSVDGPWRAEQKAATLAAWLVLAGAC
jgi:hypothetical protein